MTRRFPFTRAVNRDLRLYGANFFPLVSGEYKPFLFSVTIKRYARLTPWPKEGGKQTHDPDRSLQKHGVLQTALAQSPISRNS